MNTLFKALFFSLIIAAPASAQVLEEKAILVDSKRGEASFELMRGQHIYTYEPDDGWYKARKKVFLKPADVSGRTLSSGAQFYDEEGKKIGSALTELKLYEIDTIDGFRSDRRIVAVVQGYIFETKIADGTVPEEQIGEILKLKNRTQQQKEFKALWKANQAETREFGDLSATVIYEQDKVSAETQDFRLIMVFRGSSPYALITNGHTVEIEKVKELWEDGSFKIYYFYKASASQKSAVEDMIYTFLAL